MKVVSVDAKSRIKKRDDIPWKDLQKEAILLNLENGDYFAVNGVGLFIWKSFDGKRALEKIAARIARRYDITLDQAFADLLEFVRKLLKINLVTLSN